MQCPVTQGGNTNGKLRSTIFRPAAARSDLYHISLCGNRRWSAPKGNSSGHDLLENRFTLFPINA